MSKAVRSSKLQSPWETLPSQIDILGKRWTLKVVGDDLDSGNSGLCRIKERTIVFSDDRDLEADAADSVIHELIHALNYYLLDMPDADFEETVTRNLATGLIQVLKANPDFATWLFGHIQSD